MVLDKKRNEIIEEQRKAREEFIKLKKMQQGELKPQAKPSEQAVAPKTLGEKINNFWYHYKIHTLLALFTTVVIAVSVTQCVNRPKYDLEIMYFAYKTAVDAQTDMIADYFEKYTEDINGDGEVTVNVKNCSVTDSNKDATRFNMLTKVQAVLSSEEKIAVFVVDDKAIEYFENAFEFDLFADKPIKLGDDFYSATELSDYDYSLPDGLSVGLRVIKGTKFEKNKNAIEAYKAGEKFIEKIKKQNG